jgi:hypothetical protein
VAIAAADIAAALPDRMGEFVATGPAEPRAVALTNGGTLTSARREYKSGSALARLEVTDAQHAPTLRGLVEGTQAKADEGESEEFEAIDVAGRRAIKRWHEANRSSYVNLLAANRFMVNLQVGPTVDTEGAPKLAGKLPFDALETLRRRNEAAATDATTADVPKQ